MPMNQNDHPGSADGSTSTTNDLLQQVVELLKPVSELARIMIVDYRKMQPTLPAGDPASEFKINPVEDASFTTVDTVDRYDANGKFVGRFDPGNVDDLEKAEAERDVVAEQEAAAAEAKAAEAHAKEAETAEALDKAPAANFDE